MSRLDELVVITLVCGCRVKMHLKPLNVTSKYICRSGLGHSYNQGWVKYVDGGTFENSSMISEVAL